MNNDIQTCIRVILPFLALMAAGRLIRIGGLIHMETVSELQGIVFRILLPLVAFRLSANSDFSKLWQNAGFVCYAALFYLAYCIVVMLLASGKTGSQNDRLSFVISVTMSNIVMFGLPLSMSYCGEDGSSLISALYSVIIPLISAMSVVVIQLFGKTDKSLARSFCDTLKNPIILGLLLGYVVKACGLSLPPTINGALGKVSDFTNPLIFVCLGASLDFSINHDRRKLVLESMLMKLIVIPLLCVALGALLGFRGIPMFLLIVTFGSPTAMTAYAMVQGSGEDGSSVNILITISSIVSMFTIAAFVFAALRMGLV